MNREAAIVSGAKAATTPHGVVRIARVAHAGQPA